METSALIFFQHARDRNMTYIYKRRFSKWLIWYGYSRYWLILGMTHDYRKKAVGTLLIGYTGEEDDSAHLFLNMDKAVEDIEGSEYAVLRIKKVQARK